MAQHAREMLFDYKITGSILDWKGSFGWIRPDVQIDHPEARKNGGKIYLSTSDVEAEIEGIGSQVSFYVYADGSGLGAANCGPPDGSEQEAMEGAMREAAQAAQIAQQQAFQQQALQQQWAQEQWMAAQQPVWSPPRGLPNGGSTPKQKPARTRIVEEPIGGTVKVWKGFHGWVVPEADIDHPKYRGQLYVAHSDVADKASMTVGAEVTFYLYEDSQGLGAEELTIVSAGEGAAAEAAAGGEAVEAVEEEPTESAEDAAAAAAAAVEAAWAEATEEAAEGEEGEETGEIRPPAAKKLKPAAVKPAGAVKPPVLGNGKKRNRISELEITGEVIEWNGNFGWISPYDAIDHPAAKKREGKIYVAAADLKDEGVSGLEAGQLVSFHIFLDNSGLGAEEVTCF